MAIEMYGTTVKIVDPQECETCSHSWHGLACNLRSPLNGSFDCPCRGPFAKPVDLK